MPAGAVVATEWVICQLYVAALIIGVGMAWEIFADGFRAAATRTLRSLEDGYRVERTVYITFVYKGDNQPTRCADFACQRRRWCPPDGYIPLIVAVTAITLMESFAGVALEIFADGCSSSCCFWE